MGRDPFLALASAILADFVRNENAIRDDL